MKKALLFLGLLSVGCIGAVTSASAQNADNKNALKPAINLADLFAEKSTIWSTYPENDAYVFDRSEESYTVVAKRADGVVALVNKQESYTTPGKMVLMGTYFNCNKMTDATFYVEDVSVDDVAKQLADPAIDNPELVRGFDASMPVHDLYLVACPQS
jgi:hypothetical protein